MEATIPQGTLIGGRWRITGVLGEGGFGQVLLAVDESAVGLGEAAVKVLHPNTTPHERAAFLQEAQKIATLRHQNLVGYLDSGQLRMDWAAPGSDDAEIRPYLVTERCTRSLDDHLASEPGGVLGPRDTFRVLADVAAGLVHLHQRDLIHRDIKPGNVLWADGAWKLADFGLMRDLTATGSYHRGELLIGTPLFMAPELFSTMMATAASDVYAVGVLAHLCATGRALHTGTGPALFHNVAHTPPTIATDIDPQLYQLIAHTTASNPAARPTADQLRAQTAELAQGQARTMVAPPTPGLAPTLAASPAGLGLSASAGWAPPAGQPSSRPQAAPTNRRLALVAAVVAVVLLSGIGVAVAMTNPFAGDSSAPSTDVAAGVDDAAEQTAQVGGGPPTSAVASGAETDTSTGENVEIGENVEVGAPTGPQDPLSDAVGHVDVNPCLEADLAGAFWLTNRHTTPVGYRATVHYFTEGGARTEERFDIADGVAPGSSVLLDLGSFEEGAARCELESLEVIPAPQAAANLQQAILIDSTFDDFFEDRYEVVYEVTNPSDATATIDVTFAVVDSDGRRIDQAFSNTSFDVGAGETVRETTDAWFPTMEDYLELELEPVIVLVEYS